jgi:hypothetical protein
LCSSEDETSQYSPEKCMWIEQWAVMGLTRIMTSSPKGSENRV